jgi:hypothetical protein
MSCWLRIDLTEEKKSAAKNTGFARPRLRTFYLPWAGVADEKWYIKGHYPTQAKRRLEWGTQHLSPVWQTVLRPLEPGP